MQGPQSAKHSPPRLVPATISGVLFGSGASRFAISAAPQVWAPLVPSPAKARWTGHIHPAETAALLLGKSAQKSTPLASGGSNRYRTNKVMAHHALAKELLPAATKTTDSHPQSSQHKDSDRILVGHGLRVEHSCGGGTGDRCVRIFFRVHMRSLHEVERRDVVRVHAD